MILISDLKQIPMRVWIFFYTRDAETFSQHMRNTLVSAVDRVTIPPFASSCEAERRSYSQVERILPYGIIIEPITCFNMWCQPIRSVAVKGLPINVIDQPMRACLGWAFTNCFRWHGHPSLADKQAPYLFVRKVVVVVLGRNLFTSEPLNGKTSA